MNRANCRRGDAEPGNYLFADASTPCREELTHKTGPFTVPKAKLPAAEARLLWQFSRLPRSVES